VSGLADADSPGVPALWQSRQASLSPVTHEALRRYAADVKLAGASSTVVVGSKPNGLPAGMALHAELRALEAAGLEGDRVLQAAGANAARVLGFGTRLGRIAPGAVADLVIVAGDPRSRAADALNIVAVIRSGHFYSLVRLLEQAAGATDVE
jgi:imidazolonepropionase-like amidohydrolase